MMIDIPTRKDTNREQNMSFRVFKFDSSTELVDLAVSSRQIYT